MIVLIGFMGAGKTTVGRLLAAGLGLCFLDSDRIVEQQAGMTVAELFASAGEAGFRDWEQRVVAALLDRPAALLALGGGAVESAETRRRLAGHRVVYLVVDYAEAALRVAGDTGRPLLARGDLRERHDSRLALYAGLADLTVTTTGRSPHDVAAELLGHLRRPPEGGGESVTAD